MSGPGVSSPTRPPSRPAELGQRVAPGLEEGRQPAHVHAPVDLGQGARERDAVLQREAHAGGRLRPVAQNPPPSVRPAAEIGGVDVQATAAARPEAHRGMAEIRAARDEGGRKGAVPAQRAGTVDVGQQAFEQRRPLHQPGLDGAPFRLRQHQRHMAERPCALAAVA